METVAELEEMDRWEVGERAEMLEDQCRQVLQLKSDIGILGRTLVHEAKLMLAFIDNRYDYAPDSGESPFSGAGHIARTLEDAVSKIQRRLDAEEAA